jgi:hypothetical protein
MKKIPVTACLALFVLPVLQAAQPMVDGSGLRAGASRVDYTPRGKQLPSNFLGVLDPIYVRSVVLDNGRTRAAMVAIDAGAMPTDLYKKVSARAAAELMIPASQLLMSASHTHSVPFRLDSAVEEEVMRPRCLRHRCVLHQCES